MCDITALIRYKNAISTLPEVIAALRRQSVPINAIVAVDTGSTDGSTDLLRKAGADVIPWNHAYHASKVLNLGMRHCRSPWVLCLSSHTTMRSNHTVAHLAAQLRGERTCAASVKWDDDPFYSDQIDWAEMQAKGMKFGSIYTNSLGLLRHACWREYPFDETMNGFEDYDWALHQLRAGYTVARIDDEFDYRRSGHNRLLRSSARAFYIARRYELPVRWLGIGGSFRTLVQSLPGFLNGEAGARARFDTCWRRLAARLLWRHLNLQKH